MRWWQNGRTWMWIWCTFTGGMLIWGTLTFAFWLDSIRNLNAISVVTAWAAAAAGLQSTLSMRKADPEDPT
jgi:hypothetical protein